MHRLFWVENLIEKSYNVRILYAFALVVESVDTTDLKSVERKLMGVRVPPEAQEDNLFD